MKKVLSAALWAGAGVAAGVAISAIAAKKLSASAMDRNVGRPTGGNAKRISGGNGLDSIPPEVMDHIHLNAERLHGTITEEPDLIARDGIKLHGHWSPVENPERIIIAFHGWRSHYDIDYAIISEFWAEHNCSVFYVDQRAHGDSDGDVITFGLKERLDCVDWANFVCDRYGNGLPVYLVGISMGAATVLMAAAEEMPDQVKGILADCGFISPATIFRHVAKSNLHLPYLASQVCMEHEFRKRVELSTDSYSTLEALKNSRLPVIFFHGTNDRFVPIDNTYANYSACTAPKRLFVVPGAGHAASYLQDEQGYQRATLDFWRDFH